MHMTTALMNIAGDTVAGGKPEVKTEVEQPHVEQAASHNEEAGTTLDGRGGGVIVGGHGVSEAMPAAAPAGPGDQGMASGVASAGAAGRGVTAASHTAMRDARQQHATGVGGQPWNRLALQSAQQGLPQGR
jgi:hypothetical protein